MNPRNLESINTLNKLILQTTSLVTALSEEENLKTMQPEAIGNSLWLVSDQPERMEQAVKELSDSVQGKGGAV
ncbi:hypothetical protein [Vibrio proteolyticus]|uniref:Uncharacterized protein n=1 Tax=Vibrio proteolyticus NBRC 13287 TaxID=1219065 RepID=U3BGR3_VIBPR|nr:hypothetical protein [Vibrio proteolyticus]GAD68844.1 hypothetical protein VPR01S_20_00240 [Vibrio proteolyticus NBRC 13287]